jgi:uncharacterized UPF0160 family protein
MSSVVGKIGTHSGTFHCDEALAIGMLRLLPRFKDAEIVRTRDQAVMDTLPILVDVGAVYDPATLRFDHHQRSFSDTFDERHKTKLSSAGLIYKHFGREVIAAVLAGKVSDDQVAQLHLRLYDGFIEEMDGVDNGVACYPEGIVPKYQRNTSLPSRIGSLNPAWNEPEVNVDERFARAVEIATGEFVERVKYLGLAWLPAREVVLRAVEGRKAVHPSGLIMVLESSCPWKDHLSEIEAELGIEGVITYVLFKDQGGSWRVQTVPLTASSFDSRLMLPEPWRGVRDKELGLLIGIDDAVFVHASGFIGGTLSYESALLMATKALQAAKKI